MSEDLIARKGAARPAADHPGEASRIARRQIVVLPSISLRADGSSDAPKPTPTTAEPASLMPGAAHSETRRKFTFRIDPARHAAFAAAAHRRGISRQRLLTEALDALLVRLGHANFTQPAPGRRDSSAATMLPDGVAALPPPL